MYSGMQWIKDVMIRVHTKIQNSSFHCLLSITWLKGAAKETPTSLFFVEENS